MKRYILVPSSLTGDSKTTLTHASNTAKGIDNCEIILLSVINDEDDYEKAETNLNVKKEWLASNFPGLGVVVLVITGDIIENISEVADEYDVEYVFLKTNEPNNWEKIAGSATMDVVSEVDAPFIVIQHESEFKGYGKIILPIDAHIKSKQKLGSIIKLAKLNNATIHLYYSDEEDEFLKHKTEDNILFSKKYLENKEVPYVVHKTSTSSNNVEGYLHDLLEYANTIEANLIAVVNFQRSFNIISLPANNFENHLISNKYKVPILLINPKAGLTRYS